MTLKELIRQRLIENETLSEHLTKYARSPAVFDTEAPSDKEKGWEQNPQYPRCDYVIDMQANEERSSVGTLSITVYTERTSMVILALSAAIKDAFRDILLNPEGDDGPYSFAWARTDGFALPGTNVIGQTSQFDIVEYPDQETTDPDPQLAAARFLKEIYPDAIVLGIDRVDDVTDSAKAPILYAEVKTLTKVSGHNMHTITWIDCQMTVHVLCPNQNNNLKICAGISQRIAKAEEIPMVDGSMMQINRVQFDRKADYLRNGQISIGGRYGVLKTAPKIHRITKVNSTYYKGGNDGNIRY